VLAVLVLAVLVLAACGPAPTPAPGDPTPTVSGQTAASAPASSAAATLPGVTVTPPAGSALTPPTLIAFTQLRRTEPTSAVGAEVTTVAQFDRFAGDLLAGGGDDDVRGKTQQHRRQGIRLFAFVLSGCQHDGASLVILDTRIYAVPTGGVGVACFVAEYFLAVFAVPADRVPANVKVG
jgi:hypothetical protein